MIGMIAIVGLNTVDANMTSSEGNYTSGTNATSGNMTNGNATSGIANPLNIRLPNFFFVIYYQLQKLNPKVKNLKLNQSQP